MSIIRTAAQEIPKAWKAVFAGITVLISNLILVVGANEGFADITLNEWLVIFLAVIIAVGGVYGLKNRES